MLDVYGMVGGERIARPDPDNANGINYTPSPAGRYAVTAIDSFVAPGWPDARVPFGAELRDSDGQIQFHDQDGTWKFATGKKSAYHRYQDALSRKDFLLSDGSVRPTWQDNEFGHGSAQLRRVSNGAPQGHMIHNSAFNETTRRYFMDTRRFLDPSVALTELHTSHGCEHLHPRDFDEIIGKGYLAPGTVLVIHGYDEISEPAKAAARAPLAARNR